ncbi:MAG: aldo/keto reductase, partial [Verrucomicrobiae bacterium]|nr:aldo/keto reductase [Verrucomicrobiae bacterium]
HMETRALGKTGLAVSSIGLGCVTFGREIDAATSFAVLDHARERGINLLDTAAAYHQGASERIIGDWLSDRRCRNGMVIATKVLGPLTRERVLNSAEESLRRLRVDAIDLFQLHSWDAVTPLEETMAALEQLKQEGKILHAGCSNWDVAQLQSAKGMETIQPPYNLVQREIETGLLPWCDRERIGVLAYSPLGAGFLTGKYRPGGEIPAGTRFEVIPGHQPIYFTERGWRVIEALRVLAEREGKSMIELALGWALTRSRVSAVLVGARHIGHVDQALAADRDRLDESLLAELDAL